MQSSQNGFRVVDLFCGAGGFSEGFRRAGYEVIFGFDKCPQAIETFTYNFKTTGISGDITRYSPKKLLELAGLDPQDIDIVIGGPPCQGFSVAGMMKIDDKRNFLYQSYIRFIKYVKPKIFVMENVPTISSHDNGSIIQDIEDRFRKIGYKPKQQKLNAANFGVPQTRERLFIAGSLDGHHSFPPQPSHDLPIKKKKNGITEIDTGNYVTVEDAISDLFLHKSLGSDEMDYRSEPKSSYQIERRKDSEKLYNHRGSRHTPKVIDRFTRFKEGDKISDLPKEFKTNKIVVKRLVRSLPAPTVMTLPDDLIHYAENRILTVREMARLQSFDDKFRFIGKRTTGGKLRKKECPQYTLVGNAVPPLLAEAIAKKLLESPVLNQ
ncbi:MAG TPA: DNA (cytosine-5-)-methyltransferase [Candidatus Atribacteria bacterium]|nr:DNA (cytosine-5-)-methyltransferase [Candidatus Atribacteria bacterium]